MIYVLEKSRQADLTKDQTIKLAQIIREELK